jgi:hypothetical protein
VYTLGECTDADVMVIIAHNVARMGSAVQGCDSASDAMYVSMHNHGRQSIHGFSMKRHQSTPVERSGTSLQVGCPTPGNLGGGGDGGANGAAMQVI